MSKIMGILNVTPDSFSDGGAFVRREAALEQALRMVEQGADIIDIGGESTRPGAVAVSADEELQRVIPVIQAIRAACDCDISVDTSKAVVMREALQAGATMINDVRALQEPDALSVCAGVEVPVCLMHMQGQPRTMQTAPAYTDVVQEVGNFFQQRIRVCEQAGIRRERLILDPGFGFGKTLAHNLQLLARLEVLISRFDLPVLVGISRKSMIGALLDDAPVDQRLAGSLSAAVIAAIKGAAIIRVHDVKQTADALKIVKGVQHYE